MGLLGKWQGSGRGLNHGVVLRGCGDVKGCLIKVVLQRDITLYTQGQICSSNAFKTNKFQIINSG